MFSFAPASKASAACHAGRQYSFVKRQRSLVACNALVLKPIGDGSSDHLGGNVKGADKITLSNGLFEIGRQDVDIIINVPSVSSRHAMLRVDDERITVTDLRSTNGTYLDGNEITPMQAYEVMPGNTIIFGDEHLAMFEVVVEPDEAPAAPPAEAAPEQSA